MQLKPLNVITKNVLVQFVSSNGAGIGRSFKNRSFKKLVATPLPKM
jgi:hypothetical protein